MTILPKKKTGKEKSSPEQSTLEGGSHHHTAGTHHAVSNAVRSCLSRINI